MTIRDNMRKYFIKKKFPLYFNSNVFASYTYFAAITFPFLHTDIFNAKRNAHHIYIGTIRARSLIFCYVNKQNIKSSLSASIAQHIIIHKYTYIFTSPSGHICCFFLPAQKWFIPHTHLHYYVCVFASRVKLTQAMRASNRVANLSWEQIFFLVEAASYILCSVLLQQLYSIQKQID